MLFLSKIKGKSKQKPRNRQAKRKTRKPKKNKVHTKQNKTFSIGLLLLGMGVGQADLEYDWHTQCHCAGENWYSTNRADINWNSFSVKCNTFYLLPFLSAGILEDTAVTAGRDLMKNYCLLNRQDS